jgi:hypothetical protein
MDIGARQIRRQRRALGLLRRVGQDHRLCAQLCEFFFDGRDIGIDTFVQQVRLRAI